MRLGKHLVVKLWESHLNYLGENSIALGESHIVDYLANIMLPGPHYYYIIDSPTLTLDFVKLSTDFAMGVPTENISIETIIDLIHPEDMTFFLRCEDLVAFFLRKIVAPEKITKYKINYCLREKIADGSYRLFLLQTITMRTTEDGALLKVFGSHTDISHITEENNYRLSLIGMDGEPSYLGIDVFSPDVFDGFKPFPLPEQKCTFSKRELEVLRLLGNGSKSQEIAQELNISIQTVYTHRKNILSKSNGASTTEVIVDSIRKGLI
jgi:DNA-binding CsgD family transcriptional regulator